MSFLSDSFKKMGQNLVDVVENSTQVAKVASDAAVTSSKTAASTIDNTIQIAKQTTDLAQNTVKTANNALNTVGNIADSSGKMANNIITSSTDGTTKSVSSAIDIASNTLVASKEILQTSTNAIHDSSVHILSGLKAMLNLSVAAPSRIIENKLKTADLKRSARNQYSEQNNVLIRNQIKDGFKKQIDIFNKDTKQQQKILLNLFNESIKIYKTLNGCAYFYNSKCDYKTTAKIDAYTRKISMNTIKFNGILTSVPEIGMFNSRIESVKGADNEDIINKCQEIVNNIIVKISENYGNVLQTYNTIITDLQNDITAKNDLLTNEIENPQNAQNIVPPKPPKPQYTTNSITNVNDEYTQNIVQDLPQDIQYTPEYTPEYTQENSITNTLDQNVDDRVPNETGGRKKRPTRRKTTKRRQTTSKKTKKRKSAFTKRRQTRK
jgi:hypothetical protein